MFMEQVSLWSNLSPIINTITFLGVIVMGVINKLSSDKIANNHLVHVSADLEKLSETLEIKFTQVKNDQIKSDDKINTISDHINYLRGRSESETKLLDILQKALDDKK